MKDFLNKKNSVGSLTCDHDKELLTLEFIPRGNSQSKMQTLSGGERSFLTVSVLMSVWKCINHPFYFLDEFDVFTVIEMYFILMDCILLNFLSKMYIYRTKLTNEK